MNLICLALLCGLIATSFVQKSEARLHAESILGGNVAAVDQHTYAVSIQINSFHLCSGGILNNRYIITAAHCFINPENNKFQNYEYSIVAGVTNAHNQHEQYRVMREIAKIYIPREFKPIWPKVADIAVLKLTSGLGLNRFITYVALPANARPFPNYENQQAVVCGYGHNLITMRHNTRTNQDVPVCSGSLQCYERKFAQVTIIPNTACRNFYRNVLDSQLCGQMRQRSPANLDGLCLGDSGAPLVIGNTIVGVASGNPKECRANIKPAVYTRVTSFMSFIIQAINSVRTADMRLAKYEEIACGPRCNKKVLVEVEL